MPFVPSSDADREFMLSKIGVSSFDELIRAIPQDVRLNRDLDFPEQLSEYEIVKLMKKYSSKNKSASDFTCFMGGGAYDHFVPAIVPSVMDRPEFRTAYTPYQAEVSQGTLQVMYEFQSMICMLTGMDVANASLYDGGTSIAEACFMANAHNRRNKFVFAGAINPNYKDVVSSICAGREFEFVEIVAADGTADLQKLAQVVDDTVSAVIVQQPNFLGNIEDVRAIEKITHDSGALFVVSVYPSSLGLLEAPGNYNADIVTGEGQALGIPLSYGGPYLGLFACKKEFVRKMPGRLTGVTFDEEGTRAYVLTLQTREQQIKREKATSNICTNQGLFMLAATVYMETMGKQGIIDVAQQSFNKAHYLASEISKLNGFSLASDKPFFSEFLVKTPVSAQIIIEAGIEAGFLAGIDASKYGYEGLLVAVTEKRSKDELDAYVEFLGSFAK